MTSTDPAVDSLQTAIPDVVVDTLARGLLPKMQEYFFSPEGKSAFEEWKRRNSHNEKAIKGGKEDENLSA